MRKNEFLYCSYYQAHIKKELCWFVTAALRSYEHVAFDRTFDVATSLFEFFVPKTTEKIFLEIMAYFEKEGIVQNLIKTHNRLESAEVV